MQVYVVGPVGEWQDLTIRAQEVLCRASLIVVHDLADTRAELERIGVQARLLESGHELAFDSIVSVSPPAEVAWLIRRIRELTGRAQQLTRALVEHGVDLVSVPGPSAMIAGLVASGAPLARFTVLGLLPASGALRASLWQRVAHEPMTAVCEARADDLGTVLDEVLTYLGDREIALVQGSQVWRGPVSQAEAVGWEGYVTLTVDRAGAEQNWTQEQVFVALHARRGAGASVRDAVREVARRSGWPRRRVYELALRADQDED